MKTLKDRMNAEILRKITRIAAVILQRPQEQDSRTMVRLFWVIIIFVSVAISIWFALSNNQGNSSFKSEQDIPSIGKSNEKKGVVKLNQSVSHFGTKPENDDANSSIETYPEHIELFNQLNNSLFNLYSFDGVKELGIVPSVKELDVLINTVPIDLINQLASAIFHGEGPLIDLNIRALTLANFGRNMTRVEKYLQYHIPDYKIGGSWPKAEEFPSGEYPDELGKLIGEFNAAYGLIQRDNFERNLAEAKMKQLNFYRQSKNEVNEQVIDAFDLDSVSSGPKRKILESAMNTYLVNN